MTKSKLRAIYKLKRQKLSVSQINDYSIAIVNKLLSLPIWEFDYYHLYLPIEKQKEVNTEYLLNILSGKDKHILISKSDFKTCKLTHFLLTDNTRIVMNSYGIPEPESGIEIPDTSIQLVFVPLLAFDKTGQRVGYGKGFYDRFLAQCNPNTIKVGLSFFEAEECISNSTNKDIPLHFCVTPNTVYSF